MSSLPSPAGQTATDRPSRLLAGGRAALAGIGRLLIRLERVQPVVVLAALVIVEWAAILGVALVVRHNGWLYSQGGDSLTQYANAWLLGHGHLPHASVGYGWSIVLLPFALLGGPNALEPLPFIVLLNVLVLMPIALAAVYGIGRRIGGRLFGYWAAALWIVVPLVGIKYADSGYHQRYTELVLPQSLGLTASSAFPAMVVLAVAAYFALRSAQGGLPTDAWIAGLLAGVALGIRPSNAPYLVGAVLALLVARRWSALVRFAAGVAPSVLVLTVWEWRGAGTLPIHPHLHLSWARFTSQLGLLQEHFWSKRVLEWLALAGLIGLFRRSRPAALIVGAWFFTMLAVTWSSPHAGPLQDSALLREMIPAIPAALFLLAGIPLLFPRRARRLRTQPERSAWGSHRLRTSLVAAVLAVSVVTPLALSATVPQLSRRDAVSYYVRSGSTLSAPFGVDRAWRAAADLRGTEVRVTWRPLRPLGGTMSYLVLRAPADTSTSCDDVSGGAQCVLLGNVAGATNATSAVDHPGGGAWSYRVAAVASSTRDLATADVYVVGPPLRLTIR